MNRRSVVCAGVSATGELLWKHEAMEMWQILQLFYKHYEGDFGEQWMWLSAYQKGMDWREGERHV